MERQLKPDYGECILVPYKDEAAKQSDITNIYICIDKDTRELSAKILCLECCKGLSCTGTVTQNDISNFITLSDVEALGYTKCTGNITMADVDNCHYTTCTGTVTEDQIANFITMADVDACHFIKSISIDGLCDRVCCLEQCPGLNCVGTLVESDISDFITMHDVLSCGYTTCTGTLVASDLCPINSKITLLESCPGLSCIGTVVASDIQDFITKDELEDCYACKDIENCPGLNCIGTIIESDISDFITMADVDACCYVKSADIGNLDTRVCCLESCAGLSCTGTVIESDIEDFITYNDICDCFANKNIESCAGLNCTGTLVPSDIEDFITMSDVDACGYTTCTGTLVESDIADFITCSEANDCYAKKSIENCTGLNCTGTLVPSDIANFVTYNDICSCFAKKSIESCAGLSCIGTVVASDISNFITMPDVDACGYTTCTGTLVPSDIANFVTYNDICGCFAKKSIENCTGLNCTGTLVASDIANFIDAICAGIIANCCIDATGFADSIDCLQNDVSDIQSIIPSTASPASLLVDQCTLDTCCYLKFEDTICCACSSKDVTLNCANNNIYCIPFVFDACDGCNRSLLYKNNLKFDSNTNTLYAPLICGALCGTAKALDAETTNCIIDTARNCTCLYKIGTENSIAMVDCDGKILCSCRCQLTFDPAFGALTADIFIYNSDPNVFTATSSDCCICLTGYNNSVIGLACDLVYQPYLHKLNTCNLAACSSCIVSEDNSRCTIPTNCITFTKLGGSSQATKYVTSAWYYPYKRRLVIDVCNGCQGYCKSYCYTLNWNCACDCLEAWSGNKITGILDCDTAITSMFTDTTDNLDVVQEVAPYGDYGLYSYLYSRAGSSTCVRGCTRHVIQL